MEYDEETDLLFWQKALFIVDMMTLHYTEGTVTDIKTKNTISKMDGSVLTETLEVLVRALSVVLASLRKQLPPILYEEIKSGIKKHIDICIEEYDKDFIKDMNIPKYTGVVK